MAWSFLLLVPESGIVHLCRGKPLTQGSQVIIGIAPRPDISPAAGQNWKNLGPSGPQSSFIDRNDLKPGRRRTFFKIINALKRMLFLAKANTIINLEINRHGILISREFCFL